MLQNIFLRSNKRSPEATGWNIEEENGDSFPGSVYFARTLKKLDEKLGPRGYTFIATDDVMRIPLCGEDVVVVVHEDEWCRIPAYAKRVGAIFKTFGGTLTWAANPFRERTREALLSTLQDVRTEVARLPTRWRAARGARVFDIPLGYCRQADLVATPINNRPYDLSFAGTVKSQRAFKHPWLAGLDTPKNLSRRMMFEQLDKLKARYPSLAIETTITQTFHDLSHNQVESYSEMMLATKICLAPRGSNLETWRLFEGLRYGCAVVAEHLPTRWFYDDAPIERIRSWHELESVTRRLLADPVALQRRQEASLQWWRNVCSEDAVAEFMERCLLSSNARGRLANVITETTA